MHTLPAFVLFKTLPPYVDATLRASALTTGSLIPYSSPMSGTYDIHTAGSTSREAQNLLHILLTMPGGETIK